MEVSGTILELAIVYIVEFPIQRSIFPQFSYIFPIDRDLPHLFRCFSQGFGFFFRARRPRQLLQKCRQPSNRSGRPGYPMEVPMVKNYGWMLKKIDIIRHDETKLFCYFFWSDQLADVDVRPSHQLPAPHMDSRRRDSSTCRSRSHRQRPRQECVGWESGPCSLQLST